jgi:N-acetylneuraminic acid mutarotase
MCPRASRALTTLIAAVQTIGLIGVALALANCGGGSSNSIPTTYTVATTNYTVGGTISGLTVGSVVLANGTATVAVPANASSWVFPVSFAPGSGYSVTVQTQPAGEQCEITGGGSGMDTGDVGNVTVVCGFGQWTWEAGFDTVNASGVYGTQGTAAASNVPGARYAASFWTDSSGNFWLLGGVGYGSTGNGYLNDLWEYSPSTGQWTWVGGSNTPNAAGTYGTQGTAAASNVPGSRYSASFWTDSSGNFWLFGGIGYGSTGNGYLNDLWQYSPSTGQWTWVGGSNTPNAVGAYGTQGTASASNVPGARYSASTWIDSSGNLWLFGGLGYGSSSIGGAGNLNDLWRYSPSTGLWTWVSGSNTANAAGTYGTQGTAAAGNMPGGRYSASTWIDSSGTLWLFGGYGYDSTGTVGKLNDLWQYNSSTGQWTWVGGEDAVNASGVYGLLGTVAVSNVPGARQAASTWIDSSGNFWLFGGVGYDATRGVGNLNDLWQYNPSTSEWTWVSGGAGDNASGLYGTQGSTSVGNLLGGRNSVSSWSDSAGNLWMFGGYGYDSTGELGYLNDLWQYSPSTGS